MKGWHMDGKLRMMTATYITDKDRMLMLYRVGSRVVAPSYCGVGGHFEKEELNDARACALRELREEIGLEESDLVGFTMRYVTLRLKNGEIRQNYYFFAGLAPGVKITDDCAEGRLEWVPVDRVTEKNMPHTAYYMLKHYLETGRYTDTLYGGVTVNDAVVFTPLEEF